MNLPVGTENVQRVIGPTTGDIYIVTRTPGGKFLLEVRGTDHCGPVGRFNDLKIAERVIKMREGIQGEVES